MLTELELKKIVKSRPPGKYFDGAGLYVRKTPTGSMLWQMKYRLGRENVASFGQWPAVSLAEARKRAQRAREQIEEGTDPNQAKRDARRQLATAYAHTFEAVAREWFEVKKTSIAASTAEKVIGRLQNHVFPAFGSKPISQVSANDVMEMLRRIERSGSLETAHRVNEICSQVFRFAVRQQIAAYNPCDGLAEVLKKPVERHMPALLDEDALADYIRAARGYRGKNPVVAAALQLLPLVMLRPGELRQGEWSEIDFERREWTIPSMRMKRRLSHKLHGEPHVVPLSTQAINILRHLQQFTGTTGLIFKGLRSETKPISDNTINAALRAMGYDTRTDVTAHGFRATARTLGVEALKEDERVIDAQLAHAVGDALGRSYNRTTFAPERREFMQRWADYLDVLARGKLEQVRAA